jgi:hypothetical protein
MKIVFIINKPLSGFGFERKRFAFRTFDVPRDEGWPALQRDGIHARSARSRRIRTGVQTTPHAARAIRFARSLALVSSGAIGCGASANGEAAARDAPDAVEPSEASASEASIARADTANDGELSTVPPDADASEASLVPSDTGALAETSDTGSLAETSAPDAPAETGTLPSCAEDESAMDCAPGSVCFVDQTYGSMHCAVLDSGVNKPCGAIACGWLCACSDPSTSSCFCYVDSGPLPPPEQPRLTRRARRARNVERPGPRSASARATPSSKKMRRRGVVGVVADGASAISS